MDPIQVLAAPRRDSEAMRQDLDARFADETLVRSAARDIVAAAKGLRVRLPRRSRLTVALAR